MQIKINDIKSDFIKIQKDCISKNLTKVEQEMIIYRFYDLFESYNLKEFQWKITRNQDNGTLIFEPIRTIDKYVMKAILQ